jgi:hypothetical protein
VYVALRSIMHVDPTPGPPSVATMAAVIMWCLYGIAPAALSAGIAIGLYVGGVR